MKKYFFIEAVCVILTICFIISTMKTDTVTLKTAKELTDELIALFQDDTLIERDSAFIRESFGIESLEFSSVSYYSSDDIMNVNEIFIGITSKENSDAVLDAISGYAEDKFRLFDGYAPEQAALLDSYVLEYVAGAVIFCVCEDSAQVFEAFSQALN